MPRRRRACLAHANSCRPTSSRVELRCTMRAVERCSACVPGSPQTAVVRVEVGSSISGYSALMRIVTAVLSIAVLAGFTSAGSSSSASVSKGLTRIYVGSKFTGYSVYQQWSGEWLIGSPAMSSANCYVKRTRRGYTLGLESASGDQPVAFATRSSPTTWQLRSSVPKARLGKVRKLTAKSWGIYNAHGTRVARAAGPAGVPAGLVWDIQSQGLSC